MQNVGHCAPVYWPFLAINATANAADAADIIAAAASCTHTRNDHHQNPRKIEFLNPSVRQWREFLLTKSTNNVRNAVPAKLRGPLRAIKAAHATMPAKIEYTNTTEFAMMNHLQAHKKIKISAYNLHRIYHYCSAS